MPKKPRKPKIRHAATPPNDAVALAALRCLVEGVDQAAVGVYIYDRTKLGAIVVLLQGVIAELTHLAGPPAQQKRNGGGSCDYPFVMCPGGYCTMTGCFVEGHGEEQDD
jgi:hypothetical protein